jgi:hypothetical protein
MLQSITGAATDIDRDLYPLPDMRFVKTQAGQVDLKKVLPFTKQLTDIMNKAEASTNNSLKRRSAKDSKSAESMLTDGLSNHIGFPKPRGCSLEIYISCIFIWLFKAGVDLTKDTFLKTLLT